jgi:hypothetical protein
VEAPAEAGGAGTLGECDLTESPANGDTTDCD